MGEPVVTAVLRRVTPGTIVGHMPRSAPSLLVLLVLPAAGCGDSGPEPAPAQPTGELGRVAVPVEDLSALDDLAQLGYVDYAEPDAEARDGVVQHDAGRASPGYTLVTSLPNSRATLIDMQGRELASWVDPDPAESRWSRAKMLSNGDVLSISPKATSARLPHDYLFRMTFGGEIVWRLALDVHHDAIEVPDGRILVLTRRFRVIPEIDPERRSVDNLLQFVSADGQALEEHSLYDLLQAEPRVLTVTRPPGLENLPPVFNIDPIHANTIFWIDRPEHAARNPLFVEGRVLVTIRHLDSVALLDLAEGRCLWAWGKGEIEGPHEASVLPNGNVLLLDNGYDSRGWSRVIEMDPATGAIVWQYRAPDPEDFHTAGRGTVEALPNGNVLIGNSNSGEAFEVDREGRMVWRFLNPLRDGQGARGVIRVERYEPDSIEPLLAELARARAEAPRR